MLRAATRVAVAVLAGAALLGAARPAAAHLHLESSDPAGGTSVDAAPTAVILRFSEDVTPKADTAVLYGPDSAKIATEAATRGGSPREVALAVPPDLSPGTYTVRWKATGSDTHVKGGTVTFTVAAGAGAAAPATDTDPTLGAAPGEAPGGEESGGGVPAALMWLLRWVGYLAGLCAVGGVVFLTAVGGLSPTDNRRLIRVVQWSASTGAAAAALRWVAVAATAGFEFAAGGSFAVGSLLEAGGLALVALGAGGFQRAPFAVTPLVGAAAAVLSAAFVGHGASATPRLLVAPAAVLHMTAAAVWFGGLVSLAVVLRHLPRDRAGVETGVRVMGRFSTVAAVALGLALAGGLVLAGVQLGWNPLGLFTSAYGAVLLLKLIMIGLVIWVARYNRSVLVPAAERTRDPRVLARIGRTVRAEALGLTIAIALTAALAEMAPPTG